jgi:ketosteroid isomerase-like protein
VSVRLIAFVKNNLEISSVSLSTKSHNCFVTHGWKWLKLFPKSKMVIRSPASINPQEPLLMSISRPFKYLLAASISLCLVSPLLAAGDNDAEILAQKVSELRQAMIDADAKALKALSSPALSYGHSSGIIEDQAAFVEKIASGKSDFASMDLSEQSITVSGDTALVRHILNADIKDGGTPNTIKLGVLLVWQKQRGEWKLLARQAFKLPPAITQ